jgi:hypothetical protein
MLDIKWHVYKIANETLGNYNLYLTILLILDYTKTNTT